MHARFTRRISACALLLFALLLNSCAKADFGISVNPDGSGTMSGALGLTPQARALIASQGDGEDPLESLATQEDGPYAGGTVKRWVDGDYEWAERTVTFRSIDELNQRLSKLTLFERAQFTKQTGLLKDTFVLDAVAKPMSSDAPQTANDSGPDMDTLVQMRLSVYMPGTVVRSNGVPDGNNTSRHVWTLSSKRSVTIQITSEAWNWLHIGFLAAGLLLVVGLTVGGLVLRARRSTSVV